LVFYSTVTVTAILCAKNCASQCISASRLHPNHLAHTNTPTLLLGFVSTPATWLDWGCRARAPPLFVATLLMLRDRKLGYIESLQQLIDNRQVTKLPYLNIRFINTYGGWRWNATTWINYRPNFICMLTVPWWPYQSSLLYKLLFVAKTPAMYTCTAHPYCIGYIKHSRTLSLRAFEFGWKSIHCILSIVDHNASLLL